MQRWRREKPPYDGDDPETHREMPFTAKEYGEALDSLINFAEQTIQRDTFLAVLSERL